jgi:hypothetical protein
MNEGGMAAEQNPHLSGPDCESLVSSASGAIVFDNEAKWREHIETCERCALVMERYRLAGERLLKLPMRGEPGHDCPDARRWAEFAAGLTDEAESAKLLDHAVACDACGEVLKSMFEPQEDVLVDSLPVLGADRVREIARKANEQAHGKPSFPFFATRLKPAYWLATAATIVLLATVLTIRMREPSAEALVARAYEQNRIWPIRLPDAGYSPVTSENRASSPRNTALAEADAKVSKGLDGRPEDWRWIDLKSRIDFIRHRYGDAITHLQSIVDAGNSSTEVLSDLGTAYLARGMADENAADLDAAVDALARVVSREPANQVALFNLAIAQERMFLFDKAGQTWSRYLEIDRSSGWAAEARDHLRRLEEKKKGGGGA